MRVYGTALTIWLASAQERNAVTSSRNVRNEWHWGFRDVGLTLHSLLQQQQLCDFFGPKRVPRTRDTMVGGKAHGDYISTFLLNHSLCL